MTVLIGGLIGVGLGEIVYLLDSLGGGSTPQVVQSLYGIFVLVPFRVDTAFKLSLSWNVILVLYYGLNGLLAGGLFKLMKSRLLSALSVIGLFVVQLILALAVLG